MKNNKNAISFMTLKILPLSDEDKQFIVSEEVTSYQNSKEYADLIKIINEFKNSYKLSPCVNRFAIKNSYQKELKQKCDNLRHLVDKGHQEGKESIK